MSFTKITAALCFIVLSAAFTAKAKTGVPQPELIETATATAEKPALFMRHTGGWGAGVLMELTAAKDGQFEFKTGKDHLSGKIPEAELAALILGVASAEKGPAAEDAGYVEFKWLDKNGKEGARDYSFPSRAPCPTLLKQVEDVARKYATKPVEKK